MKRTSGFVDKEKQVLIAIAEKIGSTLGRVAKKASLAKPKLVRRRRPIRAVRTKSVFKTARRARRATRKTRSARRK